MSDTPDQPDGIDEQSRDLPDPGRSAARVNEFLSAWGDGLIPLEYPVVPPLYARDLQALANVAARPLPAEIQLIADERQRVIDVERRTPEQDDRYVFGQLIYAAAAYLGVNVQSPPVLEPGRLWPWEFRDFKPRDPESNLVRAGQLIAAEIARLQRIRARDEREARRG